MQVGRLGLYWKVIGGRLHPRLIDIAMTPHRGFIYHGKGTCAMSNKDCSEIFWLKKINIGEFEGHELFVPDGLTARDIGVGGKALMREDSELDRYKAQDVARTILLAVMEDKMSALRETP